MSNPETKTRLERAIELDNQIKDSLRTSRQGFCQITKEFLTIPSENIEHTIEEMESDKENIPFSLIFGIQDNFWKEPENFELYQTLNGMMHTTIFENNDMYQKNMQIDEIQKTLDFIENTKMVNEQDNLILDIQAFYGILCLISMHRTRKSHKSLSELVQAIKEELEKENNSDKPPPKISIGGKSVGSITMPIDILSQNLFKGTEKGKYSIDASKVSKDDQAIIECAIDYVEKARNYGLQIDLTPEKERLLNNICALSDAENEYITYSQIFRIDHKSNLNDEQSKAMDEKISQMMATLITISNKVEAEVYNYPLFEYKGPLLPAERVKVTINGNETEYAIRLFREPPLMSFAKGRGAMGHIATYTPEQWALPLRQDTGNLLIDRYFRQNIQRMKTAKGKNGKYNGKLLFSSLYAELGIDTSRGASPTMRKKKSRTAPKFRKLLDHYQKTGLIADYAEEQDGFTIYL